MRQRIAAVTLGCWFLASPACAETLLHLSDTETLMLAPDELAASLRAEATSTSAADAQQRVNAAMSDALARAHAAPGINATTGAYAMSHTAATAQNRTDRWQASQSLVLTGADGIMLLKLVGDLQQAGLVIDDLGWRLSREVARKAHDEAMQKALVALRTKAVSVAALLELRFDSFREVRLDTTAPAPAPRFMGAVTATATPESSQPNAVTDEVPVSATVQGDAVLLPK